MVFDIITCFLLIIFGEKMKPAILKHIKCINSIYPKSNIQRFPIPENFINWSENYEEYQPVLYESPVLAGKEWADPPIGNLY